MGRGGGQLVDNSDRKGKKTILYIASLRIGGKVWKLKMVISHLLINDGLQNRTFLPARFIQIWF